MNIVITLLNHILPRGFTIPVSCQHRKLASIHYTDSSGIRTATFRHQLVFRSHKRNTLTVFLLDNFYRTDDWSVLCGIGHSRTVDTHRYRAAVQLITGRGRRFLQIVGTIFQMCPLRGAVRAGCNRIADRLVTGVVELEHSAGKHTLITTVTFLRDGKISIQDNYFKIHFCGLHLVGIAFYRDQNFLDLYAGDTNQKAGFFRIRVHRLGCNGESVRAGSDLNRITAVEVVIA